MSTTRSAQSITDVLRTALSDRRTLVAAWLAIAAECIAALYLFRPWAIGDSFHYLLLAKNLADGHYGSVTAAGFEPDVLRPPGYPIILWFLLEFLGLPRAAAIALQLLAICAAIHSVQRHLSARAVNPTPFVIVAAVYPFPLLYGANLLAEPWTIVATTAAALLVVRRRAGAYALSGAAAAIAALMRSDMLLLPLVFAGVIVVVELRTGSRLAALGKSLLPIVAAALVLLPYAIWNYVHFHRASPAPVAGAIGTSLFLSTWQRDLSWDDIKALNAGGSTAHIDEIGLGPAIRQINRSIGAPENILAFDPWAYPTDHLRIAAADEFRRAAVVRIAEKPVRYVEHVLHNLWALWVTKRYDRLPAIVGIALAASSALVFVLGLAGMAMSMLRTRNWPIPWPLVPVTLYPAAIHLWLHTEARYTAATRLLLMMFAGSLLAWLVTSRPSNEAKRGANSA